LRLLWHADSTQPSNHVAIPLRHLGQQPFFVVGLRRIAEAFWRIVIREPGLRAANNTLFVIATVILWRISVEANGCHAGIASTDHAASLAAVGVRDSAPNLLANPRLKPRLESVPTWQRFPRSGVRFLHQVIANVEGVQTVLHAAPHGVLHHRRDDRPKGGPIFFVEQLGEFEI